MKLAKGFRGRYFSLAAIAATVGCANLQAVENRVQSLERHIQQTTEREPDDETETLEEIVVESALPSSSSLQNITSDVTVITAEELKQKHYSGVLEALRHQASLFVTQNGGPGQSSGFFLRGMSSEHVLVMIDGIRVNDPTSTKGQAQLEHLRLADVRQIEIVKGAQSGVWGADAGAGVINIVTRGVRKGLHLRGHLEGGSYTTHSGSFALSYGDERYAFKAGFDGYKSDGFPPKTGSDFNAGYTNRTYFAKGVVHISDAATLSGNYRKVDADFDYDGGFFAPQKSSGKAKLDFYDLKYEHTIDRATVTLFGTGSDFRRDYDGNAYDGNEYRVGAKVRYGYGEGFVDAGYDRRKSEMDESYGTKVDSDVTDDAFYGSLAHRIDALGLTVNAALRYDRYDAYEDKTTGRIGFKLALPVEGGGFLAANAGTGYRAPSLYERFGGDGFTEANDALRPESTTSYDVTADLYGLRATYFYNEITDLIEYRYGIYPAPGHYENVEGTSKIQGVELAYRQPVDLLDSALAVSYQYLDAKDAEGNRLKRRPRHKLSADWTTYFTEEFCVTLNTLYAKDYLDSDYSVYPARTVQMGEYIVFNAILDYSTPGSGGVYLKVNNLLNEKYQTAYGYNTEEQSFYAGWKFSY